MESPIIDDSAKVKFGNNHISDLNNPIKNN